MAINGSASFPPGPPAVPNIDGLTIFPDYSPDDITNPGNVTFTNLKFAARGGGNDESGPYNIANSNVSYYWGNGYNGADGTNTEFNNDFTGHISSLNMDDTGSAEEGNQCRLTVTGQVDEWETNAAQGGEDWELYTTQTSSLTTDFNFESGYGYYVQLTAPNMVTFSFGCGDTFYESYLECDGPFDQPSVDNILVQMSEITTNDSTIVIGGTSSTPSSTGLAAAAILISNGCTVTTN